ncbi:MAG: hypothetical protein AAFV80_15895 [Bacteroidota bacterium]
MSFHQLEDIVEDAIRFIHQTTLPRGHQRDLIYRLYTFHDREDTSYTRFRVKAILEEVGYLFQWPIAQHPDADRFPDYFSNFNPAETQWIHGDVASASMPVYASEGQFFFEYGDEFWKRIRSSLPADDQVVPVERSLVALFREVLELSINHEDKSFPIRWYATFVNSVLEFYLDKSDGLPDSFSDWLKDTELTRIRALAIQHKALLFSDQDDDDELTVLPDLASELEFETKPDRQAIIRFLLAVETPTEQIVADYQKAIQTKPDLGKLELIADFFTDQFGEEWTLGLRNIEAEKGMVTFIREHQEAKLFLTLILDYDMELKVLSCRLCIQLPEILEWQGREASPLPQHQHFGELILSYLSDELIESNKHLSNWGGWKYSMRSSKKTLIQRLDNLWECIQTALPQVVEIYQKPLMTWTAFPDSQAMLDKREQLIERGISFFGNRFDFKMTMAAVCQKQGLHEKREQLLQELEAHLESDIRSKKLQARIQQGLNYLREGEGTFPALTTIYSLTIYQ